MSQSPQSDREILEEIVTDTRKLIVETRNSRKEWRDLLKDVESLHAEGKTTKLTYDIDKERLRRTGQDIDCCLRSLDRQMKIALKKLSELDDRDPGNLND
jgi:hypothetical protein